ncbi:type II toxin-antitoxin system HipA family toxin [Hymenobacter guriensis]|jgi:serine/threonine-protein kinase HipA|uniref:Type II toxin-antitoxin system HipA family toxin n=1 Tax=Hymenobacter guriensis TaxID=2793065 RepID=A0ABS0L6P6_9BACT|nr:type II toxin-antitoxin system HipA family toxin [Hymenobacter guriensis]MBG8555798.1 type II toxin-antitoxin system HipA family toxin [Hymenobacter guriensis]
MVDLALVRLWGQLVGAVRWDAARSLATFAYDPAFVRTGLNVAPLMMPLPTRADQVYAFPQLNRETYHGLPGLLADALPDRFGNQLINAWLATQGRDPADFSPVERLCYIAKRGMGALEFEPQVGSSAAGAQSLEIEALVHLAQDVLNQREGFQASLRDEAADGLAALLAVGTSAGGARPKAIIAFNEDTQEVRSGQVTAPEGFGYWLLKLDGVRDQALADPQDFGRLEYAYYLMARASGLEMSECRLYEEGPRAHFMTRRFDRTAEGEKVHAQTLCALAHYDYNQPAAYSYEQAFQVMRTLRLPYTAAEQFFRRMVFNVVARNQDDHTKNISFLMDLAGQWRLAPAYDVAYAYQPGNRWTSQHQMSLNGKREGFNRADLKAVAREMNIRGADDLVADVLTQVARWPEFADAAGMTPERTAAIGRAHRQLQ